MFLTETSLGKRVRSVTVELRALRAVTRAGLLGVVAPGDARRMLRRLRRWGPVGGAIATAAIRHGDRAGLVDDAGSLTFSELDARSTALGDALVRRGVPEGATVGVLCRNHRGFLIATFGCSKAGMRIVYLNTDFAAPQAREVCQREGVHTVIADAEFEPVVADLDLAGERITAWVDPDNPAPTGPTIEDLVAEGDPEAELAPARHGGVVILTSGTTGTPKGANRDQAVSLAAPGAIFSVIPFRPREAVCIPAPMFHAWGLSTMLLTVGTGSTVVTSRRFRPDAVLDAVARHRCTGLVVVPVMLNRLVAAQQAASAARDLSGLRFIAVSGAQLEGALAARAMDAFGDVVHNLYGSTEVAYATIAAPEDLRAAPGTAGRPPLGTTVRILDAAGQEVPQGRTGRIFVGNGQAFEGYTGGGGKEIIGDLVSTGDVGHLDAEGRLFVDGRDDEMIVSGGENVFPREVEELLTGHPDVVEVAAVGVPDPDFGQRLRAFVVRKEGADLTADEVRAHVRDNLARYKVPRDVEFVDALPRNPSGKVLKRVLADAD
jgi:fatty-acyl-CoA synthase